MGERAIDVVEPVPVFDDFISGIAWIETVGPCVRFALYVDDRVPEDGGALVHVLRRKLVIPRSSFGVMTVQARAFFASESKAQTLLS